MTVTLNFNLPEDAVIYAQYSKSPELAYALWEITHNLRKKCEWHIEEKEYSAYEGVDIVFKEIYKLLEEMGKVKSIHDVSYGYPFISAIHSIS